MKNAIPSAALAQHIAFLGKTGSGKTSTAKLAVEQILREDPGARVCVLDPIKSDWWGLTSSANGRRPGLPFHILGGPRGHVPLHPSAGKAIGELVATGALPLSIIDMADFKLGGLQEFFNDFAPALLRKMRGVVHLVIEEAHEFAPKERAGFGGESMTMHYAKKLATAGRSKGIRLIVLTQRTQALHNAILGSCDTIIAHRLTAPADQKPVTEWLKASMSREVFEKVANSLASLKTGSGWICSGEAQVAELVAFPKITTYDNSATPTGNDGEHEVTTATVDRDKLRAVIGSAVEEAEANNPATLKAEIAKLKAELAKKPVAALAAPDTNAIEAASQEGWAAGHAAGIGDANKRDAGNMREIRSRLLLVTDFVSALAEAHEQNMPVGRELLTRPPRSAPERITVARGPVHSSHAAPVKRPPADGVNIPAIEPRQQRILNAVAWWNAVGVHQPSRVQVAVAAQYSATSTGFTNPLGALRTMGLLNYPSPGLLELTDMGGQVAEAPRNRPDTAELHARLRAVLEPRQWRILAPLIEAYPRALTREEAAAKAEYSATSTGYTNPLGALRSLGLIDYPSPGQLVALPILFVE